jgi:hypothetical protein
VKTAVFIGGPRHGERIALEGWEVKLPVYNHRLYAAATSALEDSAVSFSSLRFTHRRVRYWHRDWAEPVEENLLAPEHMTDNEVELGYRQVCPAYDELMSGRLFR